jgi:hypothetical protein
MAINVDELMPALEAEQKARANLDAIGAEFQGTHRAKAKPTAEMEKQLRLAVKELVAAGKAIDAIVNRAG